MKKYYIYVLSFIVLLIGNVVYAGESINTINAGICQPQGDGSEYFNQGFSVGGNLFYQAKNNPSIFYGARVAYNSISINGTKFVMDYAATYGIPAGMTLNVSGSVQIIDILPSIRIMNTEGDFNVFGQVGLGYYMMNSNTKVSVTYLGDTIEEPIQFSESKFSYSIGLGFMLGEKDKTRYEILFLYNGGDTLTANIGLTF